MQHLKFKENASPLNSAQESEDKRGFSGVYVVEEVRGVIRPKERGPGKQNPQGLGFQMCQVMTRHTMQYKTK